MNSVPFASEMCVLFDDFGLDFSFNGTNFRALLDVHSDVIEQMGVGGASTTYHLTYLTAQVTLSKNANLTETATGTRYQVLEPVRFLDDGVLAEAQLRKVGK